jgi:hypothetical protein
VTQLRPVDHKVPAFLLCPPIRRRTTRQQYEASVLQQGQVAANSMLRDWIKGQLTTIEAGAPMSRQSLELGLGLGAQTSLIDRLYLAPGPFVSNDMPTGNRPAQLQRLFGVVSSFGLQSFDVETLAFGVG